MKRFRFIAVWISILLISLWWLHDLYDSFEYFSKNLNDLIYVFAIAVAGGIVFLIYGKCSPKLQRRIRLIFLGSIAIAGSLTCVALLLIMIQLRDLFNGESMRYLVPFSLSIIALTYFSWWEFYQMLKRRQ